MTDLQLIKKRIYDEKRIEELLELLECDSVSTEQGGKLYVAALPDGDNSRSVQVKNTETLNSSVRSRGIDGDIYDIVSYIVFKASSKEELKANLPKSKYWLCTNLGYLEYVDDFYKETSDITENNVPNYNKWLYKIKGNEEKKFPVNEIIDNNLLERFGTVPYYEWIKEGIGFRTQMKFGVGIDVQSERVTFPVHDKHGNLIGVKGRYCGRNSSIEEKYKYLYVIPCNKSLEFYNFHRALPYIKEKNEIIVVEGAKTVMLLATWGYKNVVSIEGDSLSNVQISLLKELDLRTRYVFAWDKDKDAEYVYSEVQRVQGRLRYGILDIEGLLDKKDSPVDKGKEVWEHLYEENLYSIK